MNQLIALVSGKGGAGKTTVANNIGLALHKMGEESIVLDADVKNPNVALQLGMFDYQSTLQDISQGHGHVLDALHIHDSGLRIIPSSLSFSTLDTPLPNLKQTLSNIKGYMLIDCAPGVTEDVLTVLKACDEVILITNPEVPAVADTMKILEVIRHMHKPIRGIIVNRIRNTKYEITVKEISSICHLPILGIVPEHESVKKSIFFKTPVVHYDPYSKPSQEFMAIAHRMTHKDYKSPRFLGIKRVFSRPKS